MRQPNVWEIELLLNLAPQRATTRMPTRSRTQHQKLLEDTRVSLLDDPSYACA